MWCKRLDSLHSLERSSPLSAGGTWVVSLSWTAEEQVISWNTSCCSPFQVMYPGGLLYEQLFRGLLGAGSYSVLSHVLGERSEITSVRLRVAGLCQAAPSWRPQYPATHWEGFFLTGKFRLCKIILFCQPWIKHVFEWWRSVCPGAWGVWWGTVTAEAGWSEGWAWHWCPAATTARLGSNGCSSYLGCTASAGAASNTN